MAWYPHVPTYPLGQCRVWSELPWNLPRHPEYRKAPNLNAATLSQSTCEGVLKSNLTYSSAGSKQSAANIGDEGHFAAEITGEVSGEEPRSKRPRLSGEEIPNKISNTPDSLVLSPPPDTSSESELVNEDPEDEIVVRSTHAKSKKTGTSTVAANQSGNGNAMDVSTDASVKDTPRTTPKGNEQRPKRKRASIYEDLSLDRIENSLLADTTEDFPEASPVSAALSKDTRPVTIMSNVNSVLLGVWRESEAPDPDKHVVKGFIDSRERLRTRIQPHNRAGEIVTGKWPLKPGPGGSWTTFHNIIFDDHLVHLDQHQVKEYVKIRARLTAKEPEDDPQANDKLAVQQAIKACLNRGPLPEGSLPPLIAYGAEIPEHARIVHPRAEKRRRAALPTTGGHPPLASQPVQPAPLIPEAPLPDLQGHRPTKILLGFWKHSSEPNDRDKHAVFGILGNNDMFRVKVGRETRDGRPVQGNFPQGAGALWINSADWVPESYLEGLVREELKEYSRVRQYQIDCGELEGDQEANIQAAVIEAKNRARILMSKNKTNGSAAAQAAPAGQQNTTANSANDTSAYETRQALNRRSGPPALVPSTARPASQTPAFRAANRSSGGPDPRLERANNLASRAVSHIEANQAKVEQRESVLAPPTTSLHANANGLGSSESSFRDNINRLNNVWSSQEAHRIRSGGEDAKIYMGIKYERKTNGPFQGKLVSQGAIISIDGEDYVEYRVLTKPTFI